MGEESKGASRGGESRREVGRVRVRERRERERVGRRDRLTAVFGRVGMR